MLITPVYVIGADSIPVPDGPLGQLFCRVIFSQYLVFTLGIVSVYTVTCMAIDRWFAVARATKYKTTFTRRRVNLIVALVWMLSTLLNTPHLLEMKAITTNGTSACVWVVLTEGTTRKVVAILEFLGKFFLPVLVTFLTFLSLNSHVKASPALFRTNRGKIGLRLLRMCMFTALVLALCWLPNQVYYLLFKYDVTQLDTPMHHFTVALSMFNSSLNPWICCISNKLYRRHFVKLMCPCILNRLAPSNTSTREADSLCSQQTASNPVTKAQQKSSSVTKTLQIIELE